MTIINYGIANSTILLSQAPLSERLKMAGLNTVLGMGIVFAVLIVMIFIISLLKYLPGLFSGSNKEKTGQDNETRSVIDTATENVYYEESDLTDDHELVAVITAAISAYCSEVNPDDHSGGFVVRSIRKINNRRMY
ncbi:MAG TPA: OadG family protein [Mobilitalea sp.]|nr:OadG family protein [Mobilitalea sp.]